MDGWIWMDMDGYGRIWMDGWMDGWMDVYSVSCMVRYPLPVDLFLGGGVVVAAVVLPVLARLGYRFGGDSI